MRAFEVEQRVDLDRDGVVSAKHAGLMPREASRAPEGRRAVPPRQSAPRRNYALAVVLAPDRFAEVFLAAGQLRNTYRQVVGRSCPVRVATKPPRAARAAASSAAPARSVTAS